jgi:hypothetical protein
MRVWVLFNTYYDRVEGVYNDAGKAEKQEELFNSALNKRTEYTNKLTLEILELRELRQPYITEAETLREKENEAKETNNIPLLKGIRKQRKVLLHQAEHLTYEIKHKEEQILAAGRLLKSEIMNQFGCRNYDWLDYPLEGAE